MLPKEWGVVGGVTGGPWNWTRASQGRGGFLKSPALWGKHRGKGVEGATGSPWGDDEDGAGDDLDFLLSTFLR